MIEAYKLPLLHRLYRGTVFYRWRIAKQLRKYGATPPRHWHPQDPWRGKAAEGQALIHNASPDPDDFFHRLRDMREFGGSLARTTARKMILDWIGANPPKKAHWHAQSWHPQITAERIKAMVFLWGWYGESATLHQQQAVIESLAAGAHCLEADWARLKGGDARSQALSALIITRIFLDKEADITPLLATFMTAAEGLIFADGCHISRRPDYHLALLAVLIEMRVALGANLRWDKRLTPHLQTLEEMIMRMGALGRAWRHVDGVLMAIAGGRGIDSGRAEQALGQAGPMGKITHHAGDSGFMRMASGRSVVLMNAGVGAESWGVVEQWGAWGVGASPDAGVLALEFSHGTHRIIVNAGAADAGAAAALKHALASTAAHSTLTLDSTNASDLGGGGRVAYGRESALGPATGGILAVASHDGYESTHAIVHTRRIFLATGGYDLRGEDVLAYTGGPGRIPAEAVVRFHLNPKIKPILSVGGKLTLRLPGTATPWVFRHKGGKILLEDSVVMGETGLERTKAIALVVDTSGVRGAGEMVVRWGFKRKPAGKR